MIRAVSPFTTGLYDLAVQCDSALVYPLSDSPTFGDFIDDFVLCGVDAVGSPFKEQATNLIVIDDSSFRVLFGTHPVEIDADQPWALYVPAASPLVKPANGGVLRGWLDPVVVGLVNPGVSGWISCSNFTP